MPVSRRTFVASLAGVVSGCTAPGSSPTATPAPDRDGDGAPDGPDAYPTDDRRAVRDLHVAGTVTLEPGTYGGGVFLSAPSTSGQRVLDYAVSVDGPASVDCLVFEPSAWDAYVDGARDVPVVSAYSRLDVNSVSVTAVLNGREYVWAIDYTALATAPGSTSVDVHHEVEVGSPA